MVLSIPHYFVAGTKAKASEVNVNFTACKDAINANESEIAQKLDKSGGTLTGNLDMGDNIISSLGEPSEDDDAATKKYVDDSFGSAIPTASVFWFALTSAPTGFLKCNGAAVSRSTYSALFAAIGTTFGSGDGTTTFNLPDLRGEFIRGYDDGRGIDTGRSFGSHQTDATRISSSSANAVIEGWGGYNDFYCWGEPGHKQLSVTSSLYSGDAETRPRNIALLACIKY